MKNYVVGIDLDLDSCFVCYSKKDSDPKVLKSKSGKENIPLLLGWHHGKWYVGRSAKRLQIVKEGFTADNLLDRAIKNEGITYGGRHYSGEYLFGKFITLLIHETGGTGKIVFSLKNVNEDYSKTIRKIMAEFGYEKKNVSVIDYSESFSNYMFYQPRELWQYETALFDYRKNKISAHRLKKLDTRYEKTGEVFVTAEKVAEASEKEIVFQGDGNIDEGLKKFVKGVLAKRNISSVYIAGDGFDSEKFEETLKYLSNGRRVFVGNMLYAKGAVLRESRENRISCCDPVYLNDEKMNEQVSIKMSVEGREEFVPVVPFGKHWYEADEKFSVIALSNDPVEISIESLLNEEKVIEKISLNDFTPSTPYGSRLDIGFGFIDDKTLVISIKDVSSGLLGQSSGFETEKIIKLGGTYGQFNALSK